jgi:hypothetical protein
MSRTQLGALVAAPALLLSLCAGSASAAVVVSPSALHPASSVINFEAYPVGTAEPIISGGVTISTYEREGTQAPRTVAASLPHQTQQPGIFSGNYFAPGRHHFLIEFDSPVSQFGLGVHDPNYVGNELLAFDSMGNLLEGVSSGTANFPIFQVGGPTVGPTFSAFVGFVRPTADISYVELHNVFNPAAGKTDLLGIDNVMYFSGGGTGAVPEPSSVALLGLIGGIIGLVAWRKRGK